MCEGIVCIINLQHAWKLGNVASLSGQRESLALHLEQPLVVLVIDPYPVVQEQTGCPVTLQKSSLF